MAKSKSIASEIRKVDREDEPILFTEEFRRAKRNALFWSAVTLLLAIGHSTDEIEVRSLVQNLDFPQATLLLGSLVILVFMVIGYHRAEDRLLKRHTPFAIAQRIEDTAKFVERMLEELKKIRQMADEMSNTVSVVRSEIQERIVLADKKIERIQITPQTNDELKGLRQDILNNVPWGTGVDKVHVADFTNQKVTSFLENESKRVRNEVEQQLRELFRPDSLEPLGEWIHKEDAKVQTELQRLGELSDSLHGIAASIRDGERYWFYWYDRAPVYGLFGLAMFAAVIRLMLIYIEVWS